MGASLGRITARLAEPTEQISTDLIQLINENINPPSEVTADDVHVRAMYVVSDEVNSFGGRFPAEEHDRLRELLVDSPVMVGHRKDRLPIARNFHAVLVRRDGRFWVKSYFYWLRSAAGSVSLAENIDGGIYKECSIGFTFLLPECSVCGQDIRICEHEPFGRYGDGEKCHFNYRKIERVLETSLVYRGAIADTAVTRQLRLGRGDEMEPLDDLERFEPDRELLVTPAFDGLTVTADCVDGALSLRTLDGDRLPETLSTRLAPAGWSEERSLSGRLVAYRGKERLASKHLRQYLERDTGPATRVELKLFPRDGVDLSAISNGGPDRVRPIRHRIVTAAEIDEVARSLMTRDGVDLWTVDALPPEHPGYRYCPAAGHDVSGPAYRLTLSTEDGGWLEFGDGTERRTMRISQLNLARLMKGARFVADDCSDARVPTGRNGTHSLDGSVTELRSIGRAVVMELSGGLRGRFALQPIRLEGRRRLIFYRMERERAVTAS